jgi:hypothetical protein
MAAPAAPTIVRHVCKNLIAAAGKAAAAKSAGNSEAATISKAGTARKPSTSVSHESLLKNVKYEKKYELVLDFA